MTRRWTMLLLAATLLASLVATAQAAPEAASRQVAQAPAESQATAEAQAAVRALERHRAAAQQRLASARQRYAAELAEIDGLKRQRASWRRDRALRARLAASHATAQALAKTAAELVSLELQVVGARRALVAAIDGELATGPSTARAEALQRLRASLVQAAAGRAKKIVLPDDDIDPHADPEELEAQAASVRAAEEELRRQVASLERQVERFRRQAELREQHRRAGELAVRDDEGPRRGGDGRGAPASDAAPEADGGAPQSPGTFDGEPAVVLVEVIDADTVDALRRAERGTDPAAKAAAAQRARDAVARRLAQLQAKRRAIEARARELR